MVETNPDAPDYNPTAVVVAGLTSHARGDPVNQDAMTDAATLIVAASLVDAGIPVEAIESMFGRDHQFRYKYSEADGLEVNIEFIDA